MSGRDANQLAPDPLVQRVMAIKGLSPSEAEAVEGIVALVGTWRAAEAALATTRQALTGVSNAYGCFAGCTGGMPDAPRDAHTPACSAARRALAAADDTKESA